MERIKQKLGEARKQREQIERGYTDASESVGHHNWSAFKSEKNRFMALKVNQMKLLFALVIITILAMTVWWSVSSNEHDVIRLTDIEMLESQQASATGNTAIERMDMKIAALAERVDSLTGSIDQLETKLISTLLTTDSILAAREAQPSSTNTTQQTIAETEHIPEMPPPPASVNSGIETITTKSPQSSSAQVAPESSATPATLDNQRAAEHIQPAVEVRNKGPWVINLVSTSSKIDADRLVKKALSKNIQTEQQQITVKGTQYWRVQITGFSTAEDARAYADTAKKQLGLKDAWIMKR